MKKPKILSSDIQDPILREVCEKHGTSWLTHLAELKPSETVYIPSLCTLEEKARNRFILKSRASVRELAAVFNLTTRRIRQIKGCL